MCSKPSAPIGIAIHRPLKAKVFTGADRRRLNALLVYLQRAVQIRRRLLSLECRAQMGFAALDALCFGVVVASAEGEIVFANAAAERLAGDGLVLGGRKCGLGASRPLEAQSLRRPVHEAANGGAGGMVILTRPANRPLTVLVSPLPKTFANAAGPAPALALVLLKDTSDEPLLAGQVLERLYALTPAEAGVALAIVSGRRAEEIASERGVSITTVRTQIRQILEKTGAMNLRDLVRLLSGLPAVRQGLAS